jgi:glucose 1-dehydrogenase
MTLKDKVAIITGGGGGIGSATAELYASKGARVVIADFNEEAGKNAEEMIRNKGGEATFYKVDVSDFEGVNNLVEFAVEKYGSLDVMFNNAGIDIHKPFLEFDLDSYHRVLDVNQHGVFYGMQAAAKKMVELGKKGVIINTSSIYAYVVAPGSFAYHISKSAVKIMVTSAALELAPYGIRVVGIAPAGVNTGILDDYRKLGIMELVEGAQMSNKLIEPEEIAQTVAFLGSEESSAINGSIVKVDDGALGFKFRFDPVEK